MSTSNEIIGNKIACYCLKKVAERVVPYTDSHRALEIIIEGRGMTPARCIVLKPWKLTITERAQAPDFWSWSR